MKVISFINQKGGVGKTTSTIHTGSFLAKKGKKVLMIDSDPQTDLSKDCGYFHEKENIIDFLNGGKISLKEVHENLYLLTGSNQLELIKMNRNSFSDRIKQISEIETFDYVLIDCQPKLIVEGIVTINESILCASDYMVVPVDADIKAITGANEFLNSVNRIKNKYNEKLKVLGMLFSIVDVREKVFNEYYNYIKESNEELIFKTYIRKDTKIKQAASQGLTIFDFDPKARGAIDFRKFGEEILSKIEKIERNE